MGGWISELVIDSIQGLRKTIWHCR